MTDYSSLAFEAAYIERPVVYFQFDHQSFYSGAHPFRRGGFRFADDGFGPVAYTLDDALDSTIALLRPHSEARAAYRDRLRNAFPYRDGKCCERVFHSITYREAPPEGRRPSAGPLGHAGPALELAWQREVGLKETSHRVGGHRLNRVLRRVVQAEHNRSLSRSRRRRRHVWSATHIHVVVRKSRGHGLTGQLGVIVEELVGHDVLVMPEAAGRRRRVLR